MREFEVVDIKKTNKDYMLYFSNGTAYAIRESSGTASATILPHIEIMLSLCDETERLKEKINELENQLRCR